MTAHLQDVSINGQCVSSSVTLLICSAGSKPLASVSFEEHGVGAIEGPRRTLPSTQDGWPGGLRPRVPQCTAGLRHLCTWFGLSGNPRCELQPREGWKLRHLCKNLFHSEGLVCAAMSLKNFQPLREVHLSHGTWHHISPSSFSEAKGPRKGDALNGPRTQRQL